MFKRTIYILFLIFFVASCAGTFDSVKRGLTGQKRQTTDEFLIEKKDPLILPPDFENLPTPGEIANAKEEISSFEKTLGESIEEDTPSGFEGSAEQSILKKIQKN